MTIDRSDPARIVACIALHAAFAMLALPAFAADTWGGSVAVTTDYIHHGISQTDGSPATQGGVWLASPSGWSLALRGSTLDSESPYRPTYEIDLQAARSWPIDPDWSAQLAWIHYEYPNDPAADYDYDELIASLSFQQRVTASVGWSPNTTRFGDGRLAQGRRAVSYELTLLQPLSPRWSLCAGAGRYDLDDLFGAAYWYWNAGVAFTWDAVQIDLTHIDTDRTAERLFGYRSTGDRWTAAFTWRF